MHNQWRETGHVTVSAMPAYLAELIGILDYSTLHATLRLMISESRGAIHRQRELIALERLDGRDIAGRTEELRELETVQDQLVAWSNT